MFLAALAALFFCSGATALIYQVLWLRLLGLVFGVTVYAASTVWASFMAGLALGSVAAGVVADRVRHPLRWFAGAEVLIGVTALATPAALNWLQQEYVRAYGWLPHSASAVTLVRFTIAFVVLIVPTALMGATLPLVIKSSAFRAGRLGERVGVLYGTNTIGAIVGTVTAGLYLIPGRGIHRTFLVAGGLNVLVGAMAMALSTAWPRRAGRDEAAEPPPGVTIDTRTPGRSRLRVLLVVFAASCAVALGLEVVWFRVLTLFFRPTVYGFAVMLATVLAGIGIGSYLVAPLLDRRAPWLFVLAGLELTIGVTTVLSFGPLVRLNSFTISARPWLSRLVPDYLVYSIVGSAISIFPTMLLMGIAFPIGLRLWAASGRSPDQTAARRIGLFYSLNVAGSIAGSLVAGFLLLPFIGSRASLIVLACVSFMSGLALLAVSELRRYRMSFAAAACAVFAAAVWLSPDPFDQFVAQRYPRQRILWREEGVEATVVVHEATNGERSLTVNGNHQSSTGGAMVYDHHRIGHLPMTLHPNPRRALVIGLGGGATAGAVSIHEGVDVDVVELSAAVVRGAAYFGDINYQFFSRPNAHLRTDDGRNYMMLTGRKYDVVTADVIHPIYAGSGNLYSAEYFRLIRSVLKPGGLVLQWAAGTDAEYKLIARTFASVFPETTVWADGSLLVGALEPLRLRPSDFERKLERPGDAQGIHDLGISTFDQLLKMYRAGPEELRAFVGAGPVLTDDRPLVEYFLSLPRDHDVDLTTLHGDVAPHVVP
jgi:spermidine synthase